MPVHPISFSIARSVIVDAVPEKTRKFANVQPDEPNVVAKYIHTSEAAYYADYQTSLFGFTRRKNGWDCNRHYEILANGCIPHFVDLARLPPTTMHDFPRGLVLYGMQSAKLDDRASYEGTIRALLDYTRTNLTTDARAKNVLAVMDKRDATSVLILSSDPSPDYMRDNLVHGFKTLMGARCVDSVAVPYLYDSFPPELVPSLYGRGFTYTRRLPATFHTQCNRTNLEQRIAEREFDLIVYGSVHRGVPLHDQVMAAYDPSEVAYICGEDDHDCAYAQPWNARNHLFLREMY